ncbi:MAG: hypothetical protein QW753_00595 [Thermofilum sp.]
MATEVLSVRVRSDIKRRMRKFSEVDWRREIESFLERRLAELELDRALREIEKALDGVQPAGEPAWRSIRLSREER